MLKELITAILIREVRRYWCRTHAGGYCTCYICEWRDAIDPRYCKAEYEPDY